ncbi:hypothetical protein ACG3SL_14925 [Sphingomonas sp. CJ20]
MLAGKRHDGLAMRCSATGETSTGAGGMSPWYQARAKSSALSAAAVVPE